MSSGAGKFEDFFLARGHLVCFTMGCALAVMFYVFSLVKSPDAAAVLFLFTNLPFTVWLIATLLLTLLSQRARDLLASGQTSPIGGFIERLISPFGVFYYGWRIGFLILVGSKLT